MFTVLAHTQPVSYAYSTYDTVDDRCRHIGIHMIPGRGVPRGTILVVPVAVKKQAV